MTSADAWNGGIRDLAARDTGVITGTNGRRVGIKNGITSVCLTVGQSVEGWVPSAIGPDVIEDAVIVDAIAAADSHFSVAKGIRSEERRVGKEGRSRWSAYH